MANQMPGSGMLVFTNMGTPNVGNLNEAANWGGSSMDPNTVVPLLPGVAFSARGRGAQSLTTDPSLGSRLSGVQGSIDLLVTMGAIVTGVAATGTITTVAGANLVDGETFTLNDGVHAPTIFEFDSNASVTPGNIAVTFTGGDSATTVRGAIISAINGVAGTLTITASIGGAAVVNLVNDATGTAGNHAISETVADGGFLVTGMSGGVDASPPRTICFLTDDLATPTRYLAIKLDNTNKPFAKLTNNLGAVIGVMTPSLPALSAGQPATIRLAWNSQAAVDDLSGRRASFRLNGTFAPGSDWTTNPLANWASFQPRFLMLGGLLFGDADFNGTIAAVQLSNLVIP